MSNLSESMLARLPKAAREEIGRLDREVEYLRAKLAVGPEGSNTFAERIVGALEHFPGRPLGKDISVTFQYGPDEKDSIDVVIERGWVRLHAAGGDPLTIQPASSNSARVRVAGPDDRR